MQSYDINGLFPFGINLIGGNNYDKTVTFGVSNPTTTKAEFNDPNDCIVFCVLLIRQEFIWYITYNG